MTVDIGRIGKIGRAGAFLRPRARDADRPSLSAIRPPYQVLIVLVLLVAVTAGGVTMLYRESRRLDAVAAARTAALEAAESHAKKLLSYDYRTIEDDADEARAITTGKFKQEYVKTFEKVLFEQAKAQETVVQATVRAASVVSAKPDRAVVLLFVNQATQKKASKETKIDQPRVQMTLEKVDGKWLVSGVKSY